MAIATTDPRTGEVLRTFDPLSPGELEDRLARAAAAAATYRLTTFEQRAGWLRAAADVLEQRTEQIAAVITLEMGKTKKAAVAEATKCAAGLRFYADHGAQFLADEPVADPADVKASRAYGTYQPLGVVLAVMPWNFPLWQAMRFAAPALMAGNVGLLKHASNVPQSALFLQELFEQAGFPADVFQTLLVGSGAVEAILRDPRVAAATLTGSEGAGVAIATTAGNVLKKVVLELGGSDPFIVMPSADLAAAAEVATTSRNQNNGQSCIAAKRFIVHRDVAAEFEELFAAAIAALRVGDPMDAATDVGPLATESGRDEVAAQVADAVAKGARVVVGGSVPDRPGWWYPPTLLADVTPEMEIYLEEVFGPVATLFVVDDLDEAIALGNATRFGLGSNAWTTDPDEQARFVRDLQAGAVFLNGMTTSYHQLPFGGVKASGHGRELSAAGIREFCNLKSVWVG
jgi:succinate-semialdehyde dehydrogenase/glutarate-semialdehyde dehydrogenase